MIRKTLLLLAIVAIVFLAKATRESIMPQWPFGQTPQLGEQSGQPIVPYDAKQPGGPQPRSGRGIPTGEDEAAPVFKEVPDPKHPGKTVWKVIKPGGKYKTGQVLDHIPQPSGE